MRKENKQWKGGLLNFAWEKGRILVKVMYLRLRFYCLCALRVGKNVGNIERRICFVRSKNRYLAYYLIPKSGCTLIQSFLLDVMGAPLPKMQESTIYNKLKQQAVQDRFVRYLQYAYINHWKSEINPLPEPQFDNAFRFTFVRNPWARLVSCYRDKILQMYPDVFRHFYFLYPWVNFKDMAFSDFVNFVCRVPDGLCEPHFRLQSDFFDMKFVDFVGHVEDFPGGLAQIISRVNLDKNLLRWGKVKANISSEAPLDYIDFYSDKTRKLVAKKYAQDIEQFGYRFGD